MVQMALSQQNKSVDVSSESRARKYTIWLVQELLGGKRKRGKKKREEREALLKHSFSCDINI